VKLFILGAGGFAREAYCHILDSDPNVEILFIDDFSSRTEVTIKGKSVEVVKSWDQVRKLSETGFKTFTIGIGEPIHKLSFVKKALDSGLKPHETWVHPRALVQDAQLGKGGIITPGVVVTCDVKIGNYVILNLNTTVGHDAVIKDYSTCNPGVSVSGNVIVGQNCLIGTGAVIREQISIADGVTVGAQSCVVKNITEESIVVAGVPSKKLG
jgi:sugar O-acyltransferase (sialic acid O-acetyltransferase NeuD family)